MKKKIFKVIIFIVTLVVLVYGSIMIINWLKFRNLELECYRYSSGGDMNGSHYCEKIRKSDDGKAILTIESSQWHNQDCHVEEYLIDASSLKEIEMIFKKYNMQNWEKRKFSNIFVADGANYTYAFSFDKDECISFSSQIYPANYSNKLKQIDDVVSKYTQEDTKLPGLLKDNYEQNNYIEGEVTMDVYMYSGNRLYYRLLNGTSEEIETPLDVCLKDENEKKIYESSSKYNNTVSSMNFCEENIELEDRLVEGAYTLIFGQYECHFEIKMQNNEKN